MSLPDNMSQIVALLGPWGAVAYFLVRDLLGVLRSLRAQGERIGKLEDAIAEMKGQRRIGDGT